MGTDALCWCSEWPEVQKTHKAYRSPPFLLPTWKAASPFHTWAIELICHVGAGQGAKYIIVCVCIFSRWVEVGVIWDKQASTIASWFHSNKTCRFGTPVVVRSDRGSEFRGVFHRYLRRLGVHHALILPQHLRANGLVERVNGVMLQGIRHLLQEVPDKGLEEVIPDVLAGLRMLPAHLGVSPFVLAHK